MKPIWPVFALALLFACGSPGGGAANPTPTPPTSALIAWQGFPADSKPRPIVWLTNYSPANGFQLDGGKIAFMCNKFVVQGGLPKNLPAEVVAKWSDGTTATYAGIGAFAALTAMSKPNPLASADCATANPLVITGATVGAADYGTDRGKASMTSWLFTAAGALSPIAYPALDPSAFWNGRLTEGAGIGPASVSADGLTVTYRFWGSPNTPGACGADYTAAAAESKSAVAVGIAVIPHATPGDMIACEAIAQEREVTVALAAPLAGRVLANSDGQAVAVCPAALARDC